MRTGEHEIAGQRGHEFRALAEACEAAKKVGARSESERLPTPSARTSLRRQQLPAFTPSKMVHFGNQSLFKTFFGLVENFPLYGMVGIACGLAAYTPIRHLTHAADIA